MSNKNCIFYATDANYLKHTIVSILSLKKFYYGKIYVFSDFSYNKINSEFKKKLQNVKFIKIPKKKTKSIIANYKSQFFRYLAPSYLKNYEKILYIDSDTIIINNIYPIFNIKLKKTIAAVKEPFKPSGRNLYIKNLYNNRFNCGVLLIDPKKFIKNKIEKKLLDLNKKLNTKLYADQALFNVVIKDQILEISKKWNFLDKHKISKTLKPVIFHFNNHKPWIINHKSNHKQLYRFYRRKIDKYFIYDDLSLKNIIKKIFQILKFL